jgi:hypothetical protein
MGKFRWISLCGVFLVGFTAMGMAGSGSDVAVFFQEESTPDFSATLATFATTLSDGTRTAVSVSNTMGTPMVEGVEFDGFPEGSGTEGPVWLFCYNTLAEGGPQSWVYRSSDDPVGTGLTEAGILVAGGTWIFFLDEVLATLGFDSSSDNFVGYCYVVGEFDAIVGTYVNTFESIASQQAFPMQADFAGVGIEVTVP